VPLPYLQLTYYYTYQSELQLGMEMELSRLYAAVAAMTVVVSTWCGAMSNATMYTARKIQT